MRREIPEEYIGRSFKPAVKNNIKLTLAFTKAVSDAQDNKSANVVFSAYNAATCLSMVAKGAAENTREEMAQALFGVSKDELDAQVTELKTLNDEVLAANKDSITLLTANSVWVDEKIELNGQYETELRDNFDAEIHNEDFNDPQTVEKINQWASDNTNELIDNIKEELSDDDVMVLASALYVKAPWTSKFDKELTEDKDFTADNGTVFGTPTMTQEYEEGMATYLDADDYEAVALTYGEKNEEQNVYPTMRLVMVRPKDETVSARDWLASQANGKLPVWTEPHAFERAEGSLEMPRIDMKDKYDLQAPMEALGIKDAFSEGEANFKPMTERAQQLYISEATQDIVFKTDEEGSEAAAVTQVTMALECAMPMTTHFDVKFDRSFVLAMQDIKTGAILFAGAINEPNDDMKIRMPSGPAICPRPPGV